MISIMLGGFELNKEKTIRIERSRIPENLDMVNNFFAYTQQYLAEELPISQTKILGQDTEGQDFDRIEMKQSIFQGCMFVDCTFKKASFIDVFFKDCNFSNSNFSGSYFERCQFISCKCVGCNMSGTSVKHTQMQDVNWQYSYFDQAKLMNVVLNEVDFTEVSISEATLKNFAARGTRFIRNNFFKTMLSGISFVANEFMAPIVSSSPVELRGIKINAMQAVDLASIWGIVVE